METTVFNVQSKGGIFSKFIFYVFNYAHSSCYDNIYIDTSDERATKNGNPFNFVFDQTKVDPVVSIECGHLGNRDSNNTILNDPYIHKYIESVRRLKFNEEMLHRIDQEKHKVGRDVLGVHVRVTDMNIVHREYGVFTTNDYIEKIKQYDSKKKIFVASDNMKSIELIKKEFGSRVSYVENLSRAKNENDDILSFQEDNISEKFLWQEAFLEMILLSMCGSLIVRTSNLSNTAMIYSDMEQNIDWL